MVSVKRNFKLNDSSKVPPWRDWGGQKKKIWKIIHPYNSNFSMQVFISAT